MRDIGITIVVAALILFAGVRFSAYDKKVKAVPPTDSGTIEYTQVSGGDEYKASTTEEAPFVKSAPVTITPQAPAPVVTATPSAPAGALVASLEVADQPAGMKVSVISVSVPEGSAWVAVHEDQGGVSKTLGAKLFAKGTSSGSVELLRPTVQGATYTVSLRRDNGDRAYSRQNDLEIKDQAGSPIHIVFKAL